MKETRNSVPDVWLARAHEDFVAFLIALWEGDFWSGEMLATPSIAYLQGGQRGKGFLDVRGVYVGTRCVRKISKLKADGCTR